MIGIMVSVTIVKFMLMVYCRRFKNEIVRAYAQDHFFDVITNSIGLAAAVLAIHYYWWIDPTGAILVSSYATDSFLFFFILKVKCHSVPGHGLISGMRMELLLSPWS